MHRKITYLFQFSYTESSTELTYALSKAHMLVLKLENLERTTDVRWATTTLPHADAGNQTRSPVVACERHTPALSRPLKGTDNQQHVHVL